VRPHCGSSRNRAARPTRELAGSLRERVLDALATVYDPELDEPITELGFVTCCEVGADGDVAVRLRLPTSQCAPNFAFLMAADARDAVRGLPGVRTVGVVLEDHMTDDEINAAVARDGRFADAFPGETRGELHALRDVFRRKALVARQAGVCQALLVTGATPEAVTSLRVVDLPEDAEVRRCLHLRAALGIACDADAAAFVLADGRPVAAAELERWLRMARLVRTSLESNGGLCRALLERRSGLEEVAV
jgi:metal-sulfur cluster biosynthetic enzyme